MSARAQDSFPGTWSRQHFDSDGQADAPTSPTADVSTRTSVEMPRTSIELCRNNSLECQRSEAGSGGGGDTTRRRQSDAPGGSSGAGRSPLLATGRHRRLKSLLDSLRANDALRQRQTRPSMERRVSDAGSSADATAPSSVLMI